MVASLPISSSFLLIAAVALLLSPATSQTCKSQKLPQTSAKFTNCTDLPTLEAYLHWAYYPSAQPNPTLNIAFTAPAQPDGWVAWALNPTGYGMVGAQALAAFKDENGSLVVKTYNISSYGPITESRISYEVVSKRAEYSGGVMRIFAMLELPPGSRVVNQVWQVGASVKDGVPVKHNLETENLNSKGTLLLGGKAAEGEKGDAPLAARPSGSESGGPTSCSWKINENRLGLYGVLMLLGIILGF